MPWGPSDPWTTYQTRERRRRWYVRAAVTAYVLALIVLLLALYGCWGVG